MDDNETAPPCENCGTHHDDPRIMLDCSRKLADAKDKKFVDKINQMPLAERIELLAHMIVNHEIHMSEITATMFETREIVLTLADADLES